MAAVLQKKRNLLRHEKIKENYSLRPSGGGKYRGSERKDARYADGDRYSEGNNQCLKKRPRRRSDSSQEQREGSDHRRPEE